MGAADRATGSKVNAVPGQIQVVLAIPAVKNNLSGRGGSLCHYQIPGEKNPVRLTIDRCTGVFQHDQRFTKSSFIGKAGLFQNPERSFMDNFNFFFR